MQKSYSTSPVTFLLIWIKQKQCRKTLSINFSLIDVNVSVLVSDLFVLKKSFLPNYFTLFFHVRYIMITILLAFSMVSMICIYYNFERITILSRLFGNRAQATVNNTENRTAIYKIKKSKCYEKSLLLMDGSLQFNCFKLKPKLKG